jgi:hypothetical protein
VTLPFARRTDGGYAPVTVARVISIEALTSRSILQIAFLVEAG